MAQGHFYFEYRGQRTSDLDFATPALGDYATSELRKIHADLGNVEIDYDGNCNEGWNFNINWGVTGDYEMIKLVNINVTGVDPVFESIDIRSGGVWVRDRVAEIATDLATTEIIIASCFDVAAPHFLQ